MRAKRKLRLCLIFFLLVISIFTKSMAMSHYQTVGSSTGIITATTLNVRRGPGTNFEIITTVDKNQYIRIFAKIGDWYVIQTEIGRAHV